ncbi:hypothetical protein SDC9_144532 [bioreactor metagenome]|uniref:Uncharacterized protein n=1 Tax=bioreactor metagenome TaxID=1076179 RepID=A0A645E751_9ZZZZ
MKNKLYIILSAEFVDYPLFFDFMLNFFCVRNFKYKYFIGLSTDLNVKFTNFTWSAQKPKPYPPRVISIYNYSSPFHPPTSILTVFLIKSDTSILLEFFFATTDFHKGLKLFSVFQWFPSPFEY